MHKSLTERAYPIGSTSRGFSVLFVAKLLGLGADADAITDFLDAHVSQMILVHLHEVLAIDVIVYFC